MSVALADLVPTLKRTLNPPGQTLFTASNSEWVGRLADAFWDGRLQNFFVGYVIDLTTNSIAPVAEGGAELGRDFQSVIVRYAALRAIHAKLLSMPTSSRQKAGSVEVETQRSATLLVALLKDISAELETIKVRLRNQNSASAISFLDSMVIANNRVLAGVYETVGAGFVN